MPTTPLPDEPLTGSASPPIAARQPHALFLRQGGTVSGPFPRRLLEHYRLLGRIAESDTLSEDRITWLAVGEVLGDPRHPNGAGAAMASDEERDWREERRMARLRWIDERSGTDRRQSSPDAADRPPRSSVDRRDGWTPGQGGATGATGVVASAAKPRSVHAHLTVAALIVALLSLGLGLWLFAPRFVPHITLLR
ncbi:MAG: hypothetical protein U1F52_18275 [Burkholderiales bacterium]